MAGRIKVYENGASFNSEDTPVLLKEFDEVSEYDQSCGTFGVGDYTRDSGKCPSDSFICTEGDETPEQLLFGECMYALDCHMNYNMKSILANSDPIVTFIHQMNPHHQNVSCRVWVPFHAIDAMRLLDSVEMTPGCRRRIPRRL